MDPQIQAFIDARVAAEHEADAYMKEFWATKRQHLDALFDYLRTQVVWTVYDNRLQAIDKQTGDLWRSGPPSQARVETRNHDPIRDPRYTYACLHPVFEELPAAEGSKADSEARPKLLHFDRLYLDTWAPLDSLQGQVAALQQTGWEVDLSKVEDVERSRRERVLAEAKREYRKAQERYYKLLGIPYPLGG